MNLIFRRVLAVCILFFLVSFVTDERDKNLIYWDQRVLTWEDFKGRAPSSSPYVALTNSAIQLDMGGEGTTVWFEIESIFYPKLSWKKKNVDDHVLKHEQGHYDITEIYSRILRQKVGELRFKKYDGISADVQKLFSSVTRDCKKMQDLYDKETDHSKIKDEQTRWDGKIQSMLDSLSAFKDTHLKVDVSYLLN